jgi:signal transduction histidine kinase
MHSTPESLPVVSASPFEPLFGALPWGVAWTQGRNHVQLNSAAARLWGAGKREWSLEDYLSACPLEQPDGKALPVERHPLLRALAGAQAPRQMLFARAVDGRRVQLHVQAVPLGDGEGALAAVFFDTAHSTEDPAPPPQEWLAALGHEVKGASHSISLAAGLCHRYLNERQDVPMALHHIEILRRNSQLLTRLVSDFVEAVYLESPGLSCRRERLELGAFVRDAVEQAELPGPTHPLTFRLPASAFVFADPGRLQQILVNLLDNAEKYSSPGPLLLGAHREATHVVLWLRDTGPGIAEHDQPSLFHRYARLPSRRAGLGMGLWMARELARRMGGELWLNSRERDATTFFLSIPAA